MSKLTQLLLKLAQLWKFILFSKLPLLGAIIAQLCNYQIENIAIIANIKLEMSNLPLLCLKLAQLWKFYFYSYFLQLSFKLAQFESNITFQI